MFMCFSITVLFHQGVIKTSKQVNPFVTLCAHATTLTSKQDTETDCLIPEDFTLEVIC